MLEPQPKRRIPRILLVVVPVLVLGLSLFLINLAWKSNREIRGQPPPNGPTDDPFKPPGSFVGCTDCHQDLDKAFKEGKVDTLLYRHEKHFAKGVSDCSVCHPPNTHEPDKINKPTMSRCFTCHGVTKQAIAPGGCNVCHPPGLPAKPQSHLADDWAPSGHSKEAKDNEFECLTCHKPSFCTSCHGLPMPHPKDWELASHMKAFFQDPQTCESCHPRAPQTRDFCDTCHHPQGPKNEGWRSYHQYVVEKAGAFECFQCHSPDTCASCHVKGKESFAADRHLKPSAGASPGATPEASPSG